jgi:hypothetical protein
MGYSSRSTVYTIIRDAQASHLSDAVQEHRRLELARLDALQASLWVQAMDAGPSVLKSPRMAWKGSTSVGWGHLRLS